MAQISQLQARFLALAVTILWSSSWVLIRVGFEDTDLQPLTFAGLRYALAATILGGWVAAMQRAKGASKLSLKSLRWRQSMLPLVGLGVVQYAATQGSQFVAIESQPAATTSLLLAATPMLVAFGGVFVGEPPRQRHFVGAGLAVIGAAIYFTGELGATTLGMIAAIITVLSNAGSALVGRVVNRQRTWSARTVTLVSMSTGAMILLVVGISLEGPPRLSVTAAMILVWLAAVNTAAAFTWWNVVLRELPAMEVVTIQNTMGIQIPLLGWLFLNEPLGPAEICGLTLAALGAWIATSSTNHPRRGRLH